MVGLLGNLLGNRIGYGANPGGVAGGYGGMLNGGMNTSPYGTLSDLLTGLGVGLLSQQPSTTPISPLAGVGQGIQYANQLGQQRRATGQQQFQNSLLSQDAARQQQAFELEKQKGTREQAMYDQQQARMQAFADTIQDPQKKAEFLAAPEAYIKNQLPAPSTDVQNYNFYTKQAQDAGQTPLPFNDWQLQMKRATANMTTLNMPKQDSAYLDAYGKDMEAYVNSVSPAADAARSQNDQLAVAQALRGQLQAAGTDVSALAPLKAKAGALAQAVGIDPSSFMGTKDDPTGAMQALDAVTKRLALGNIGSGKEGAIPANNFSEADRNFVVGMAPNLADTPDGFQWKVEIQRRVNQRAIEKEALWNSGKYNQLDPSGAQQFKKDWAAYVAKTPLFAPQERDQIKSLTVKSSDGVTQPGQMPQVVPIVTPQLPGGFQ